MRARTNPRSAPRRPPHGSQARADRTRASIIDETIRCIREEGFEAASANHIAKRAGVTWGVVQYHFGGREALLMAVVSKSFTDVLESLRALPPTLADLSTRQRTEVVVAAAWEGLSTPTSMAALAIMTATRMTRVNAAAEHLEDVNTALADVGKQVGQNLDVPRAVAVGNLIWTALQGMAFAQLVVHQPLDTARELRTLVDVVSTYIDQCGTT